MTAREIFGLILRVSGLVLLYRGIIGLIAPLATFWTGNFPSAIDHGIVPIIYIAISLYLLKGAPALVRFCYGRT